MASGAMFYQQAEFVDQEEELQRQLEQEEQKSDGSSVNETPSEESNSENNSINGKSDDGNAERQIIYMIDPSEHRPDTNGKELKNFRRFYKDESDPVLMRVYYQYIKMHKYQTVDFVRGRYEDWNKFNKGEYTIMEALEKLNDIVDETDPDSDLPNIVHAFQTAERIREAHPEADWMHLTGLIHDLGKVLACWGEEHWAVCGDTFIVGCEWPKSIVYYELFDANPDKNVPEYQTKYGIYEPNCGLENVLFSSSHDVYLYRVLKNHKACTLPDAGLKMILLHSFYPWHDSGDYMHLCNEDDIKILPLIKEFNKFDLYTKAAEIPDVEKLKPYYQSLIDKYMPGKIKF